MKEIANLMKLDFITLKGKSILLFSVLMLAAGVLALFLCPHQMVLLVIFTGFAVQPVFVVSEQSGYNKLYGILPVKKRSIVFARFALIAVVMLVSAFACIVIGELAYKFSLAEKFSGEFVLFYDFSKNAKSDGLSIPLSAAFTFLIGSLLTAMEFTLLFIFGSSKEVPASIGAAFVLTGIFVAVVKIFDLTLDNVAKFLGNSIADHLVLLYICLYGGGLALLAVGAMISAAFFCKKEL